MKKKKTENFKIQRKIVAAKTTESWQTVPHVTYMYEPDVTAFYEEYKKLNAGRSRQDRVSVNTLMLKVITEGLKAAPVMNSHLTFNRFLVRGKIETFESIDISMPTILDSGEMMTLNLHGFENKNLDEMTAYINDVRKRAQGSDLDEAMYGVSMQNTVQNLKKGKVVETIGRLLGAKFGSSKVKHLRGKQRKAYQAIPETQRLTTGDLDVGTVTISNIGSTYLQQHGAMALLEIIPPQVCAIGIGAVQDKPVVVTDSFGRKSVEARKVLPICIAFDHRALDFGDIVPFLQRLDQIFAHPAIIHSWTDRSLFAEPAAELQLHALA